MNKLNKYLKNILNSLNILTNCYCVWSNDVLGVVDVYASEGIIGSVIYKQ